MRGSVALVLLTLASALPVRSQPAEDPIGDVLHARALDPDEPDAAAEPAAPPAPAMPPASPGADQAYDARVRSSMASAQRFQGALDGGWALSGPAGELYLLEIADHGGVLEGAWRDPRRPGALDASGFIDQAERTSDGLMLRFASGAVIADLHGGADGRLTGELREGGRTTAVGLRRRER